MQAISPKSLKDDADKQQALQKEKDMRLVQAFFIALSMYSKIPVPHVDWDEKNMKYAMCFFPAIGAVTGICVYLAGYLLLKFAAVSPLFLGAALTLIPVFISGGIHLDGFMDTTDALASYGDKEKKLAILKDSHTGAFAVLGMCIYMLVSAAVLGEITLDMLSVLSCTFVLSRALSGFSVVTFPAAKDSGLLKTFQERAQRKRVRTVMVIWAVGSLIVMAYLDVRLCLAAALCALAVFAWYAWMSKKKFGGITGDLAGYFLSLCELLMAIGIVTAGGGLWR